MPYTLTAGLLWYSGALLLGLILGWLLRSTSANRQVGRARRLERAAVQQELSDLKARVDSEEELRLERNRLRHDNELLREQLASRPLETGGAPTSDRRVDEQSASPGPDLEGGARVLGRRLSTDDLQVVNGIGPVIEGLLESLDMPDVSVRIERLMAKDSLDITDADRQAIVYAAQAVLEQGRVDALIITHGTDTLAETAVALHVALGSPPVPVVITGAMRPYRVAASDAAQNVAQALMAARLLVPGVHAVMHGRAIPAERVVKDYERLTLTARA